MISISHQTVYWLMDGLGAVARAVRTPLNPIDCRPDGHSQYLVNLNHMHHTASRPHGWTLRRSYRSHAIWSYMATVLTSSSSRGEHRHFFLPGVPTIS